MMTDNIWAIAKHPDIKHLLLLLAEQLGSNSFVIDHSIAVDDRAIYLQHREAERVRAYVYTLGQQAERYGVHLEFPESMEPHENVSLASLVAMLSVHFDIAIIHPLPYESD